MEWNIVVDEVSKKLLGLYASTLIYEEYQDKSIHSQGTMNMFRDISYQFRKKKVTRFLF